jgi:hypothetical protein
MSKSVKAKLRLGLPRRLAIAVVALVGSLANLLFVIFRQAPGSSLYALSGSEISLPPYSAPAYSSAAKLLKCATGLAFSIGIPDPVVTLAIDFGDSQVFLVSALALSARAFSDSVDSTFHKLFELVSWSVIAGSAIELPCATALELALAFAGHIMPAGHPWNLPSTSEIDRGPPIEPHDMSIAAGWERIKALTRQTESSLAAAFAAVPVPQRALDFPGEVRRQIIALNIADSALAPSTLVPDPRSVLQPRLQS